MIHFTITAQNPWPRHQFYGAHCISWREVRWILRNGLRWMDPGYTVTIKKVQRKRPERLSRTMARRGKQALKDFNP